MTRRLSCAWVAAALTGGALIASTGSAHAQLGLPLGGLGQVVTDAGTTVGGALPAGGGVVTGATGTVGGIVTGATGTVTGAVDQVLGAGGGLLGGGALDSLLGTLGVIPDAPGGAGGAGGAGGPAGAVFGGTGSGPAGSLIDARSPNVKLTVLSRLSRIARTGRIPLKVTTDEAGIVAFRGSVRPGRALKRKSRRPARKATASKPIRFPSAVLAYRRAGSLRVTIQLSRSAQRRLGKVRNARMSMNFLTADVRRNQGRATIKRTVRR